LTRQSTLKKALQNRRTEGVKANMTNPEKAKAEDSRAAVKDEPKRPSPGKTGDHPEDQEGAAKATEDNDLTTGHSQEGDGGDANSKQKT
jgi:hypothetical protein